MKLYILFGRKWTSFTRFYAAPRTGLSLGLIKILFIFYAGLHVVYFECIAAAKIAGDV